MAYVEKGTKEILNLGKGWEVYSGSGLTSAMYLDLLYKPFIDNQEKKIKIVFNLRIRFSNTFWEIEPWGDKLTFKISTSNKTITEKDYDVRGTNFGHNDVLGVVHNLKDEYITTDDISFSDLTINNGSTNLTVEWGWDCFPTSSYANFSNLSGKTKITISGLTLEQLPTLTISSTSIKVLDESAYLTIGKSSYSNIELIASSTLGNISLKKSINTTSKAQTFYFKNFPQMYSLIENSNTQQIISFSLYSNNKKIAKSNNIILKLDSARDYFKSNKIVPSITYNNNKQICSFSLFGGFLSPYAEYGQFQSSGGSNYQVRIIKGSKQKYSDVSLNYNITSKNETKTRTDLKATGSFPLDDFIEEDDYSENTFKIQLIDCKRISGNLISFKISRNKTNKNEIANFKAKPSYDYENGNSIINAIETNISFTVEKIDKIKSITLLYNCVFYNKSSEKISLDPAPQFHYSINKEKIKGDLHLYKKFTDFQFIDGGNSSTQPIHDFMKTETVKDCVKIEINPQVILVFDDNSNLALTSKNKIELLTKKERIKAFSWDENEFQFNIPVRRDYLSEEITFPCGSCFPGIIFNYQVFFSVPFNIPVSFPLDNNGKIDYNNLTASLNGKFYVMTHNGLITNADSFVNFNSINYFETSILGISENLITFAIKIKDEKDFPPGTKITKAFLEGLIGANKTITVFTQRTGDYTPVSNPLTITFTLKKEQTNE